MPPPPRPAGTTTASGACSAASGRRREGTGAGRLSSGRCFALADCQRKVCMIGRARLGEACARWPIYFFVAVAFWNLVGAGLFGFLINPPISLYYLQGLNLTPVHGHTALFGVYGMLGIGLLLFSLRALSPVPAWRERPLAIAFWSLNIGLLVMVALSMLPIGVLQAQAAVEHGLWYARSEASGGGLCGRPAGRSGLPVRRGGGGGVRRARAVADPPGSPREAGPWRGGPAG
jgi:hypothetical protein